MSGNRGSASAKLKGSTDKPYGTVPETKINVNGHDEEKTPEEKKPSIPYYKLFRFADGLDRFLIFLGLISALIHGAVVPLFPVVFGNVIDAFNPEHEDELRESIKMSCLIFVFLGGVAFISSFFQLACLLFTSQRQANRIRRLYFNSLLRQEIGWYDKNESGELLAHIAGDVLLIQEGIGEKLGTFTQMIAMFFGGFFIGFFYGWKLSLVILSVTPILAIGGAFLGKLMAEFSTKGQAAYAKAGGIAEEVISCIRTVAAFGGENSEIERYGQRLAEAKRAGVKAGHLSGAGLGFTFGVLFCSYGLAFWYGSTLIASGEMEAGDITTVFFSIILGALAIGQGTPSLSNFASASGGAVHVFEVIDRASKIDSLSDTGFKGESVQGNIEFKNVKFTYPSRPDAQVLRGIDLKIERGRTVALVGASGCGKSTCISLIQRFYDAESGTVTVDGRDIREYSIRWLRSQIGVVNQEPVLFAKSIRENIILGKENATQEEIEEAAKKANAHGFISRLPQGYDTLVGERGAQLSGGQKQRVAIARAIIRDPEILLLDEATSALDAESEKQVQVALEEASKGRTTIVVAHRLSTIRNADTICVFDQGLITEQGTHEELIEKEGIYFHLVQRQTIQTDVEATSNDNKELLRKHSEHRKQGGMKEPDTDQEKKSLSTDGIFWRTIKLNSPEWLYIGVGIIASTVAGLVFPIFSLIFSEMLNDLLTLTGDELKRSVRFWSFAFVLLGVLNGLSNYFQTAMFAISGERLTERMRKMAFKAILRQDIGWFDDKANSTGVLTTKLANDASEVKGATGQRLGNVFQGISTLGAGLTIALVSCWQLSLAVAAIIPIIAASGALRTRLFLGYNEETKKAYEQSGQVASEAIENIRTVSSLGRQEAFINDYNKALAVPIKAGDRGALVSGSSFGFAEMMAMLIWAFSFWYGTELVLDGKTEFDGMMKAISAVVFGATMLGQIITFAPDYSKAKLSAASIFQIVDRIPPIDHFSPEGTRLPSVNGEIEVSSAIFSYPTRPDVKVLKGLSVSVKSGETLALVGSSGCGKSTIISLLERFYLLESGSMFLDGVDLKTLNLAWLRTQIGIVGQEPILFATSIKENIAYGKPGATMDEIIEASKKANAHSYIVSLPDGYETMVGEKGTQLSGGQKQRVAIARALIRNPKILLLDEATSALDAESEKVVQEALDRAREGRTTIVIAHRLSTIQNASVIAVVDQGKIVEKGKHSELLAAKGLYHNLVQTQVNTI